MTSLSQGPGAGFEWSQTLWLEESLVGEFSGLRGGALDRCGHLAWLSQMASAALRTGTGSSSLPGSKPVLWPASTSDPPRALGSAGLGGEEVGRRRASPSASAALIWNYAALPVCSEIPFSQRPWPGKADPLGTAGPNGLGLGATLEVRDIILRIWAMTPQLT